MKCVKAPAMQKASNPSSKGEKEIKPIIIDDTPITSDMSSVNNRQDCMKTKLPINLTTPDIHQPYPQPVKRLSPRPPDILGSQAPKTNTGIGPNLDFEENSPFQEGIITEMYESPDKSYIEQPQELTDLVDSTKLMQKYLPKQVDIDKIMDVIRRKVLKGTHLPLTIKEIQAGYLNSPFFQRSVQIPSTKQVTK